eukprot:COSAG04_NODE_7_length_45988_cov_220.188869_14_plen_149_part_00
MPRRRGEEGDAAAIVRLVREGASPNAKNAKGQPADPNATTSGGATALMGAAAHGHAEIVAALLRCGAAVDATDSRGQTALVRACYGQADCARLLLEAGAAVDAREEVELAERMGKAALVALLEDRLSAAEKVEWEKRKAEIAAEPDDY